MRGHPGASALVVASSLVIAAPRVLARESAAPTADEGEDARAAEGEVEATAPEAPGAGATEGEAEDRRDEALAAFQRARERFQTGAYEEAAEAFLLSYRTLPSLEALVAAALAFERAGRLVAAAQTYREYLEFEDDDVARREEALAAYQGLRSRIGEVQVRVGNPAAIERLSLNGEELGLEDFPRLVMPGVVSLKIVGVGGSGREIDAEVRPGGTTLINIPDVALVSRPPPKTQVRPPVILDRPPPPARGPGLKIALWSGVGVTAAAAVAMATLGGLALDARADYEAGLCPDAVCSDGASYPFAEEQRFYDLRAATNVMVGVSAGVAVVTAALGIALARQRSRSRQAGRVRLRGSAVVVAF